MKVNDLRVFYVFCSCNKYDNVIKPSKRNLCGLKNNNFAFNIISVLHAIGDNTNTQRI